MLNTDRNTVLPTTGWLALALVFCGLFLVASHVYRGVSEQRNPNLSLRTDELVFHAPEIDRIAAGGALVSPETKVAMIPGYHSLLAPLPEGLRVNAHLLLSALALFAMLLLSRALLPRWPAAATAAWLTVMIGPYTISQAAWINTDAAGRALFALALISLASAKDKGPRLLLPALLAAACVLTRSIYLPALLAVFALGVIWPGMGTVRKACILGFMATAAAAAPFLLSWQGLTPPGMDAPPGLATGSDPLLQRSVIFSQLFWIGALALPLWLTRIDLNLKPVLPCFLTGVVAVSLLLMSGMEVLQAVESPQGLKNGSLMYMLYKLHLPPMLVTAAQLGGIFVGATFAAFVAFEHFRSRPASLVIVIGLLAYLLTLCLQQRPYNRYFEFFVLLVILYGQRHQLSPKISRYLPLIGFYAAYAAAFHLFVR